MSSERLSDIELVPLRNGEWALRDVSVGEIMHPAVGPWKEANSLYVEQTRLSEMLRRDTPEPFRAYDVGLGGAANAAAILTCAADLGAQRRRRLELVSFERDLGAARKALDHLQAFPFLGRWAQALESVMAEGRWEGENITWLLRQGDVRQAYAHAPQPVHLIAFDPFSPKANPELWTPEAFSRLRQCCQDTGEGSVLATYSAATRTRVSLLLGGFFVGVGCQVGGKGETTVASTRKELLEQPLGHEWLARWSRSSAQAPHGTEMTPEIELQLRSHLQFVG